MALCLILCGKIKRGCGPLGYWCVSHFDWQTAGVGWRNCIFFTVGTPPPFVDAEFLKDISYFPKPVITKCFPCVRHSGRLLTFNTDVRLRVCKLSYLLFLFSSRLLVFHEQFPREWRSDTLTVGYAVYHREIIFSVSFSRSLSLSLSFICPVTQAPPGSREGWRTLVSCGEKVCGGPTFAKRFSLSEFIHHFNSPSLSATQQP